MAQGGQRQGELIAQRYTIDTLLGRGVLGEAYLCSDTADSNARVVLKVLRSTGKRTVDSYGAEIARLMRVHHPGLARVLGFGTLPDRCTPFVVEEFLQGNDLLRATQGSSVPEIVRMLADVCRALSYLHENRIIHRGLKPSNGIVVDDNGQRGAVKLLHYGLLQFPLGPAELSATGAVAYIAPEVLYGRVPDVASDLYAVGILAYELLTRRVPFEDDDQGYLVQKHLHGRIDMRLLERLEWGPALGQVIRALLDRDPDKRPSSANEVLRLLRVATGSDLGSEWAVQVDSYFAPAAFVGRSREMSLLRERAAQVQSRGRGWTMFITGESGSGKTRCMEEFRVWGMLTGWRVLEGSCTPGEEKTYAPYRQLFAVMDRLYPTGPERRKDVLFRFEDVPMTEPVGGFDVAADSAAGQFRDSLTRELVRRLADRPTILLLHDFHWSDEATTAVLDYLTSDITSQSVLVCVSLRPGDCSPGLTRLMDQCCRQSRAEVVGLEPLTEGAVRELITSLTGEPEIGKAIGERLYHASGGNPFFLEETLKHLVDRGLLRKQCGKWQTEGDIFERLEMPAGIGVLIKERLGQLSSGAAELARWLAVFQRSVSADLLRVAASDSVPTLDSSLSELLARHLVRQVDDGGEQRLDFRHTLLADVVRKATPAHRRRTMHLKIAEVLEKHFLGEDRIQELALHYTEGHGGEKALGYALRAAAMYRSEFANQSALRLYSYILEHPGSLDAQQLCEVAVNASETCCALGLPKQAIRIIRTRMSHLPRTTTARAQLNLQLSRCFQFLGRLALSKRFAKLGLRQVEEQPSQNNSGSIRAALIAQLAFCMMSESRPLTALELASSALASIKDSPKPIQKGHLYILISGLCCVACEFEKGRVAAEDAIRILEPVAALDLLPIAYSHLGINLAGMGRLEAAARQHEKALIAGRKLRAPYLEVQAMCNLAECYCRSGRYREARAQAERALKTASTLQNKSLGIASRLCLSEIQICCGELREAESGLCTMTKRVMKAMPVYLKAQALYLNALLQFHLNRHAQSLRMLNALDTLVKRESPIYEDGQAHLLRALMMFQHGKRSYALKMLESLERRLIKRKMMYQLCRVRLSRARLLYEVGRYPAAIFCTRRAIRIGERIPALVLEAEARLLLAEIKMAIVGKSELGSTRDEIVRAMRLLDNAGLENQWWRGEMLLARLAILEGDRKAAGECARKVLEQITKTQARLD